MVNRLDAINNSNESDDHRSNSLPPNQSLNRGRMNHSPYKQETQLDASQNGHLNSLQPPLNSPVQVSDDKAIADPFKELREKQQSQASLRRQLVTRVVPGVLVPVAAAGALGYLITSQQSSQESRQLLQRQAIGIGDATQRLIDEAEQIPSLIAANPAVVEESRSAIEFSRYQGYEQLSVEEAEQRFSQSRLLRPNQRLNDYLRQSAEIGGVAELFFTDKNGFNLAYSNPTSDFVQRDEEWWQRAQNGEQQILAPIFDESSNTIGFEVAKPIIDPASGQFLGAVKAVVPTEFFNKVLTFIENGGKLTSEQIQIIAFDNENRAIPVTTLTGEGVAQNQEILGGEVVRERAAAIANLLTNQPDGLEAAASNAQFPVTTVASESQAETGQSVLVSTLKDGGREYTFASIPGTNWVAVASANQSEIAAAGRNVATLFALAFVVVGAVSALVMMRSARHISRPLTQLASIADQAAVGNLDIYADVKGNTEVQTLASSFNALVNRVRASLAAQAAALEQSQFYTGLANAANRGDTQYVFDQVVQVAKKQLLADRVVVYRFDRISGGSVVAEAAEPGLPLALEVNISDACIPRQLLDEYRRGRVVPTSDVQSSTYSPEHKALLAGLGVKANLVVPIVAGNTLVGILVAHQCSRTRIWKPLEIDYLKQLADQTGLALSGIISSQEKEFEARLAQMLADVSNSLRQTLDYDEILQRSVDGVRKVLQANRVLLYRFNPGYDSGVIAAESVEQGWMSAIGQTIEDPLVPGAVERYKTGRVSVIDKVSKAELTDCHCAILERLQVKANIVAPLVIGGELIGLLCAHHCQSLRVWKESEINTMRQLATQVGSALNQAVLIQRQRIQGEFERRLNEITYRMRQSLDREQIFDVVLRGVREAIAVDRAVVYLFDENWKGSIKAESVSREFPAALGANIYDPCFAEDYVEKYKQGRVQTINNIETADIDACYRGQLEPFKVKANIVAPIVVAKKLLGLLVAHQCSAPRDWQEAEISFFRQIATQLGFTLEQAELFNRQQLQARFERQLNEITSRMRQTLDQEKIYDIGLKGVREAIALDRAIIYLFDEKWQGTVAAESVDKRFPAALGASINDPCFAENYVEKYKQGRVQTIENLNEAKIDLCYRGQLEPFDVKASIVAPILVAENLMGLFVGHQCSSPRQWKDVEITFFRQLAVQIGFAIEQSNLFQEREQARLEAEALSEERQQQKEALQKQLINLLGDVEDAAKGDLTVRAEVTADEIGIVADFFNSIVESLRQIVVQVKQAAGQVNVSLGENEGEIRNLAESALKQAEDTTRTLASVEKMTVSIQAVANSARQAALVAHQASDTATTGGAVMDLTVQNILGLRETVAETAKKVKRLGESSQQISKVVSLINQIALQTNLLAINAGIEAARAGEEGQGFAVVAEEVGELAARSANATQEIEKIVANIQLETSEVVSAMEQSTSQVVEGTRLVDDVKQSLNQIVEVSRQIDQLVHSISEATVSQVETSEIVSRLMKDIAQISEQTSTSSRTMSGSLNKTVKVAQELQASVETFKVGPDA
ncbi:MAG: GAF domain-containing protein [Elainellaceae cyanobacterium]